MPTDVLIGLSIIGLLLVGGWWARVLEKREWNEGSCDRCGYPWKSFDMDSQGGRGYKCVCVRRIWISYPGVDRRSPR